MIKNKEIEEDKEYRIENKEEEEEEEEKGMTIVLKKPRP